MALQKTAIPISFAKGLDLKSDPWQVQIGNFLSLVNSVFDTGGRLTKRNGYGLLTTLPVTTQTTLSALNGNLVATGANLYAYSADSSQWINQGLVQPVSLGVLPLVRNNTSQSSPDTAVASNGLVCLVYVDTSVPYFQVSDSATGLQVVPRTSIASVDTAAAAFHNPRVFLLGNYFMITYTCTVSGTPKLRYIAIPISTPTATLHAVALAGTTVRSSSAAYDGFVTNNSLYLLWAATSSSMQALLISNGLIATSPITVSSTKTATLTAVTADISISASPVIWFAYYDSGTNNTYVKAYDVTLTAVILVETLAISSIALTELTAIARNQTCSLYVENANTYSYSSALTDYVSVYNRTQAGADGGAGVILRSVGLASKPFMAANGTVYLWVAYGPPGSPTSSSQPVYFLIDASGNIYCKLAYTNGGGYAASMVLPSVSSYNGSYYVPYLIADQIVGTNKTTPASGTIPSGTQINPIFANLGVNLAKFSINTSGQYSSEIASALHLTGGFLWEYDGVQAVEHNFHVYPENIGIGTATGSGGITAGTYFYQFCYEWTDNAGNLHRSAPSIPVSQVTTTSSSTNTLNVPTLRLTAKQSATNTVNDVRIVGYRWSIAQPIYYKFSSANNDPTVDSIQVVDTASDSQVLSGVPLYTNGGVVEDIAAPACIHSCLYKSRLFLIDAEDQNLLWFSKQVIENVPVEMSDLFTLYIAPTTGVQGSSGPMTALSAMDDKLIIFKQNTIYYITGNGPDNTGANNDFSEPIFVTAAAGCNNPNSIVLIPNGLMFQSNKGIWLLGRDMQTSYIGAPVEAFNSATVLNATVIPNKNRVLFVLNTGVTLMYDYFYGQWGTFTNVSAESALIYNGLHTYLNKFGQVFQETPGLYLDGSIPVLMSFTTSWIAAAGLQGFERLYSLYLLGSYFTPFKLNATLAYNFNSSAQQATLITPTDNVAAVYGGEASWGSGGPWGGSEGSVFSARLFPQIQKCESFQLSIQEVYDPSFGIAAGQGLNLSGLMALIGLKKASRTQKASRSFG